MGVFISDFLRLNDELSVNGVFDALIDKDSNFYINILRLKNCTVPEFSNSYDRINAFFGNLMLLLSKSSIKGDRFYRQAYRNFNFSGFPGINLGFSHSKKDAGFGEKLRRQVISDAFDIVKSGSNQPEIFHLVGLFEKNIAGDRVSDMIASLIIDEIKEYTRRINRELNVNSDTYPEYTIINGIIINPYKKCELYYLPKEILHQLPLAQGWDDINDVIEYNQIIRDQINDIIGDKWEKMNSDEKKDLVKSRVFCDSENCMQTINSYISKTVGDFAPYSNLDYNVETIYKNVRDSGVFDFPKISSEITHTSYSIALDVLNIFKDWVENNKGWELILETPSRNREKTIHKLIQLSGKEYCTRYDYDFTFEANEGPGPLDIKISRGAKSKTVIEVKLNTNPDYLHGYDEQLTKYAKAEGTKSCIFLYVKVASHPKRDEAMMKRYQVEKSINENAPKLFIIDSQKQVSASKKSK